MTKPKIPALIAELELDAGEADRLVCDLASGKRKWEMCIPVRDTDSDIVLSKAIRSILPLSRACLVLAEALDDALWCTDNFDGDHDKWCDKHHRATEALAAAKVILEGGKNG